MKKMTAILVTLCMLAALLAATSIRRRLPGNRRVWKSVRRPKHITGML